METSQELYKELKNLEDKMTDLRKCASELRQKELKSVSLAERLVYAAHSKCPCGAGLAYDPCFEDKNSVFAGPPVRILGLLKNTAWDG